MDISDVRVVFGPDELMRVGAFRYGVYVEEQGKQPATADHERKVLVEPADRRASSTVFWIEREGAMVGTLRAEILSDAHEDSAHLGIDKFAFLDPGEIVYFTRLMVAESARRSDVTPKLCWLGFLIGLLKGCSLGVITCRPELVPVFEKYGYLQYASTFAHPEWGLQVPMAILGEVEYLRSRGAPLTEWLAQYRPESPLSDQFLAVVDGYRRNAATAVARQAHCLKA